MNNANDVYTEKLLPCPFCGRKPKKTKTHAILDHDIFCYLHSTTFPLVPQNVVNWNRRVKETKI